MLRPDEFDTKFSDDELVADLPDRPISSLRDVQYLYGLLYTRATAGGGEYASYLTPNQSDDLLGEPESLIALKVDFTGEEPTLPEDPIYVTTLHEDLVADVAHCDYDSARGIDHSITHRSGQDKDPAAIANYLVERLTRWATDEDVEEAIADHPDGWIIEALADLGEREGIAEEIESAVSRVLEGTTTALTTVMAKLAGADSYRFPGELANESADEPKTDVFQHAMRERKRAKLISKNEAKNSAGQAVDLVTGETGRTVGTAEDPLNYFLGKQMERFPNFDVDEAWRAHPISEDSAIMLMNAETFVNRCAYFTLGARVHYLPYFAGRLTPGKARALYRYLYRTHDAADLTPVEQVYDSLEGDRSNVPLDLRFYVSAIRRQQDKRYDVLADTMNGSLMHPIDLSRAHNSVLGSWIFSDHPTISAPLPSNSEWPLLSPGTLVGSIASGQYFGSTFTRPDDDQDVAADDYRIRALVSALAGDPLEVGAVLDEYVGRLIDDDYESFPSFLVSSQFAQLQALAAVGLLESIDERYRPITEPADYDTTPMQEPQPTRTDGGSNAATRRADKLESFIEDTPALADNERRSSFLMGALIGQISNYQAGVEQRSTTLVDQYPIKGVTVNKVKRLAEEAISKNVVYSRENGMRGTMYAEIVDALRDSLAEADPETWEIDTTDLRFYYALGVSYGLNSYAGDDDADDEAIATEV